MTTPHAKMQPIKINFSNPIGAVKPLHGVKAFNELYKLGTVVERVGDEPNEIFVCAAKGDAGDGAVLIVSRKSVAQTVELQVFGCDSQPVCTTLDTSRRFEEVGRLADKFLSLPPQAVVLLRYSVDPEMESLECR